jgi:hypothetical protein
MAEEGITDHNGGVEGTGQFVDQVTQTLDSAGDAVGGPSGSENIVEGTKSAGELVLFVKKLSEHIEMGKEREID